MSIRNLLAAGVGVCVMIMVVGCAKAPQDQINKTTMLIDSVKVEAEQYAQQEYSAARGMLDSALAEVKKESVKMALTRDYDKTQKMLSAAVVSASAAREAAVKNKAAMVAEAQAAVDAVKASLEEVKKQAAEALKSKKAKKNPALATVEADLAAAETALVEAAGSVAAGSLAAAKDGAAAVAAKLEAVKAALAKKK